MWRSSVGDFEAVLEGCFDGLLDQQNVAGIVCSTIASVFGVSASPSSFYDPDYEPPPPPPMAGDMTAMQMYAERQAKASAHKEWLRWRDHMKRSHGVDLGVADPVE